MRIKDPVNHAIVLNEIADERHKQEVKWGQQNHPDPMWATILGEEFGEACQAALKLGGEVPDFDPMKVYEEIIQCAAVACNWAESFRRTHGLDYTQKLHGDV